MTFLLAARAFLGSIPPWAWKLIGILALGAAVFFGGAHWQGRRDQARYEALKTEYAGFVATVKAQGEAAAKHSKEQEKADIQRKKDADDAHAKTVSNLKSTIDGLRKSRPSSGFVPAAPAGSSRPDLICFDRAEYIRTDGEFTTEARGLADEGSTATIDLNSAKSWAQGQ